MYESCAYPQMALSSRGLDSFDVNACVITQRIMFDADG
jgi:hypothetical protein